MKKLSFIIFVLFSLLPTLSSAQGKPNFVGEWYQRFAQGKTPARVDAFRPDKSDFPRTKHYNLRANINQLNSIMNTKPDLVNLIVPYGEKTYTLNLAKVEVTSDEFRVGTNQGNVNHDTGVQYRGIVDNNPEHIASLNLTKSDKSAFFSTNEGNFVIAREDNDYIVYNDQEMELPGIIYCQTPSTSYPINVDPNLISGVGCKTVNIYFECDYAFYQNKGSNITTLTNFIIGFFNQVATIYANEDIAIKVSEIFAWTSPDPYAGMSSNSDIMNAFKANRGTSFNGHIAHFLSTRTPLGGISYVNTLCNKAYAFGVSRISSTFANFPTYSWTVNVVAHELGHAFGSPHTHSCTWSGGPIDNCATQEGTCSPGPTPVGGGTIMSYCHMTSSGINFNNGFGPLPGNLIRSKVQNASCIPATTEATPPASLAASNITSSSAILSWLAAPSTTTYTIQYKPASASTWTTATTSSTTMTLTGLSPNSNYLWSVKTDCSPYATNAGFTTTGSGSTSCLAPTQLSSTGITQTGATLNWAAVSGATGYTVQYKASIASTWQSLNTSTNSATISGLIASTNYSWQVKASCSTSYSAQSSFTTASSSTCTAPTQLASTNITQTSATLSWAAVPGATGYTIQYKTSTASTWTTVTSTSNSRSVSGLVANTNYVWQVKASCYAGYSVQASFTTASSSSGCTAPTQLTSSNITTTSATLSWSPVSGATSYTIQYRRTTTSTWTTVSSATSSRSITGLTAGASYVWQVKTNCSAYSAQASFTTTSSSTGCTPPSNLAASNITSNSATITWTGPSNATSYSIRYKLVGASGWTIKSGLTGNSYTITGLSSKRNYQYVMNVRCSNGTTSSLTLTKYFTTL